VSSTLGEEALVAGAGAGFTAERSVSFTADGRGDLARRSARASIDVEREVPVSEKLNAVVSQRIEVSPGLVIMRVVPEGWELPEFTAGQYTVLGLHGSAPRDLVSDEEELPRDPMRLIKRAYSIASSSSPKEFMEFYISLLPSGALSPRLFALNLGDRVWLSPKVTGVFTLEQVPADRNVALISTGTGLAPYMSMLRTRLMSGQTEHFAVLHGARHSWDLGYRSELMSLSRKCSQFTYVPSISRPEEEPIAWAGETGYVQDLWTGRRLNAPWGLEPNPGNTHIFLCGNPSMIETMLQILAREGYEEHTRRAPGQIHVEKYW
jgi:ferredoxin--NADP+ reductase